MQTRPQLSITFPPDNTRDYLYFLNKKNKADRPRSLHEVIYKVIALDHTIYNRDEDIMGVFKEYLEVKGVNTEYMGIKAIKARMRQDIIAQQFFKLKGKGVDSDEIDSDENVVGVTARLLEILNIDPVKLLQRYTNKNIDIEIRKTIKLSKNRKPVIPGQTTEQKFEIPQIPTSSPSNVQKPEPGITDMINTIAFLNEDEKQHLENEICKEAVKVGMKPAALFEYIECLPFELAINDNIPLEIKMKGFVSFVDTEVDNNNKQILDYLFYQSIIHASYNALELLIERLVKARMTSIFRDENKLNLAMDFLVGQYGMGAAVNLMNKVDESIHRFTKLYAENKENKTAHTVGDVFSSPGINHNKPVVQQSPVCDAFSNSTNSKPSVNPLKPGVPQLTPAPQPSKISQASTHVYSAFSKPLFFCMSIEKTVNQFTNDIAFLEEKEKNQLKHEIGIVAKREGKSADKIIALLKAQSQEPLFIVDRCGSREASEIISRYEAVIDKYLNNKNTQILTYLFYNSVMSNNPHTVELTFHKLYKQGWSLLHNDKFGLAMDLLYATHGEQAYRKMAIGIESMSSQYKDISGYRMG